MMSLDGIELRKSNEQADSETSIPAKYEEVNDSPIEEVRLTVPITDDPFLPVLTFRTWVLGILSCILLSFINQFFNYRQNGVSVTSVPVQLAVLPIGKLMASTLPTKSIRVPRTQWSFSLNPGPFNMKEHVLITIFASTATGSVYALHIVTLLKAFYKRGIHPVAAILIAQTTQMLGYGWAGVFRKFLVDSPYMWWPANLVQVSLFRALHENERRPKGGLTRFQFFIIAVTACFAYTVVPAYLFPSITALSFICWIWPKSITAQQIGAGVQGLGLGSFALDWNVVSFIGSPLAYPAYTIICALFGAFTVLYVVLPIAYWTNAFEAKRFPLFTSYTYDASGQSYNVSRILNSKTFDFNQQAYDDYSKVYLSIAFAITYGLTFATLTASLSHVALFHGKSIWKQTKATLQDEDEDVHQRIMKRNYKSVPEWWFYALFAVVVVVAIATGEGFSQSLQLPYWGLLLAIGVALVFTLPIGIITATTNQTPGLNVITELIIGYVYPGKPVANVAFKTYGYTSMAQAIFFLSDMKLGHYMKIPPKSMFLVQLVGTVISNMAHFGTAWWLLTGVENICLTDQLPTNSPWTCPGENVFYSASVIWGVVGPLRMFGKLGVYGKMNWFFLFGLLAPVPVWWLNRRFPQYKWIRLIHIPVILNSAGIFPVIKAVNVWTWGAVGIFFNIYVYRKYKGWWARHNYILSAGLDAGLAFMTILIYFVLQMNGVNGPDWWGADDRDHCPLAKCPTDPSVKVDGCPALT